MLSAGKSYLTAGDTILGDVYIRTERPVVCLND